MFGYLNNSTHRCRLLTRCRVSILIVKSFIQSAHVSRDFQNFQTKYFNSKSNDTWNYFSRPISICKKEACILFLSAMWHSLLHLCSVHNVFTLPIYLFRLFFFFFFFVSTMSVLRLFYYLFLLQYWSRLSLSSFLV